MRNLISQIKKLKNSEISSKVNKKLSFFKNLGRQGNSAWFSELCFCLLTANSKAETALKIQKELGRDGFLSYSRKQICSCIYKNKHRFHNNKSKFIVEARKFSNIKDIILKIPEKDKREWLVNNIKGLGWKEASHFLRNVGFTDYAIIDRHVLNILQENSLIKEKPKNLNKKKYLEIEKILEKICIKLNMSQAELDLYLWYMKTGKILK